MNWVWIILLSFLSQIARSQDNNHTVDLLSYNIRLDHAGDNEDNWHHRKSDMVEYLSASESDFIGLQEAIGHQLAYLDNEMIKYTYLGVARDDGAKLGEYSPILYDSTRWRVAESNTFWLSSTPHRVSRGWDAAYPRVCTYGLFISKITEDTIIVLNTHFDHVGKIAREESIRLIIEFIVQFDARIPLVLMGDFNFTPDDENYNLLTIRLTDSHTILDDKNALSATFNNWKADSEATRRIDYIFVNDPIILNKYYVDQPKTKKHRQLSDHYPVIVEISLK